MIDRFSMTDKPLQSSPQGLLILIDQEALKPRLIAQ